ncbi:MAG: thiol protease/hemagglutinin PrtT [Candidatus Symbiothrix sp.]|nr:thiol protease/hemagglutinin PrtT [Candidatus Symbiothrix sp.]
MRTVRILLLVVTSFLAGNSFAKQRTVTEARNEAQAFVQSQPALRSSVSGTLISAETGLKTPYYYVFNQPNNTGFVIIAGDDRAKTVLGYADKGHFDVNKLPSNMKHWLAGYEHELTALAEGKITKTEDHTPQFRASSNFAASVAPLIQSKWDQSAPYNNSCPLVPAGKQNAGTLTITGCMATAMAQVMRYHQYPIQRTATIPQYTTETLKISIPAITGSTTYDWANMSNTYNGSNTLIQNIAVATLMYHCGVAVEMDYNVAAVGGSAATTYSPAAALTDIFGYDPNLQYYTRNFYSDAEWMNLIKTDLNANRPLLYSGQSARNGGHQFICDGYDTNDYFHFNWGWSGEYDGYFVSSALNAGWLGGDGFNWSQVILTGIQPPNASSTPPPYQIVADTTIWTSATTIPRNGIFDLQTKLVRNLGANIVPADSYLGFGLYNSDQVLVDITGAKVPFAMSLSVAVSFENFFTSVYFPAEIPNGDYRLCIIHSLDGVTWTKVRVNQQYAPYLPVTLTSSNIIFTQYTNIETLVVPSQQTIQAIAIVDIMGRTVLKQAVKSAGDIPNLINQLPGGIYILQKKTESGVSSEKFIKK